MLKLILILILILRMLLVYFFLLVYKLTCFQHKHDLLVVQGVELDANYMVFQFFQGMVYNCQNI